VTHLGDRRLSPEGVHARNPSFDVTPARLVSAIFTERGVIDPVGPDAIRRLSTG
jgi:methylthioribose-1-phosphate isomerase